MCCTFYEKRMRSAMCSSHSALYNMPVALHHRLYYNIMFFFFLFSERNHEWEWNQVKQNFREENIFHFFSFFGKSLLVKIMRCGKRSGTLVANIGGRMMCSEWYAFGQNRLCALRHNLDRSRANVYRAPVQIFVSRVFYWSFAHKWERFVYFRCSVSLRFHFTFPYFSGTISHGRD